MSAATGEYFLTGDEALTCCGCGHTFTRGTLMIVTADPEGPVTIRCTVCNDEHESKLADGEDA